MAKRPDLVILTGALKGRHFEVGETPVRLGRSSSNDIHVPDEELSRNHCLFERVGEAGLRITDLASANGTIVNGVTLGNDPVELKEGDLIEVGQQRISVGEPPAAREAPTASSVDLGLGARQNATSAADRPAAPRRSPLLNILWILAVLVAGGAIALILLAPSEEPERKSIAPQAKEPVVREVYFEKVQANSEGIFRYALSCVGEAISVKIDDTANGRTMPAKTKTLSKDAQDELAQILSWKALKELDPDYDGPEPDPPALESIILKVVYSTGVRTVSIRNTDEPETFTAIREKLETFSKNELGVWAIAYSREKLIELAEEAVRLGDTKWEDRDANYGNLFAAMTAYQEAIFYLETVNPKPDFVKEAMEGLKKAKDELTARYKDQRFKADKALNLSQWESAAGELKIILEMIPDPRDDRNGDARKKLVSAESKLKGVRK